MKIFTTFIILIFIAANLLSQVQSNCERSWGFDYYYKKDVAYLTYERLRELKLPDTNEIYMPYIYQDTIWRGISAIYNAESIPGHDSVFSLYCIHNYPVYQTPNCSYIEVLLDTTYNWTDNWFDGNIETGYDELDNFTSKYNFIVSGIAPQENIITLNSFAPINITPLLDSLLVFDGVLESKASGFFVEGNEIHYEIDGNFQYFDFALQWGDCLSGCSEGHIWKYKVNLSECTVEYLGAETSNGEDYPDQTNCVISDIDPLNQIQDITIYPNPANNFLFVSTNYADIKSITIFNTNSQLIKMCDPNQSQFDISNIPSGFYIIKIACQDEMYTEKLIIK